LLAQFYLCYPWLWKLYQRWGSAPITVLLCLGCWGGWLGLTVLTRRLPGSSLLALAHYLLYFNLPYRLPEFAIGIYLAVCWQNAAGTAMLHRQGTARKVWSIFLVLVGLGLWGPTASQLLVMHIYWVAVCLSLGLALFCTGGVATLGAWPPVARAAAMSFSFYLLHQPVIGYSTAWARTAMQPFVAFVVVTVCAGVVSLLMSLMLDKAVARLQTTSGVLR
jgi:peptidoglycan/LPS O-acetylase OafA/YrhL